MPFLEAYSFEVFLGLLSRERGWAKVNCRHGEKKAVATGSGRAEARTVANVILGGGPEGDEMRSDDYFFGDEDFNHSVFIAGLEATHNLQQPQNSLCSAPLPVPVITNP